MFFIQSEAEILNVFIQSEAKNSIFFIQSEAKNSKSCYFRILFDL